MSAGEGTRPASAPAKACAGTGTEAAFLAALAREPGHLPSLWGLARQCEARGDRPGLLHWLRQIACPAGGRSKLRLMATKRLFNEWLASGNADDVRRLLADQQGEGVPWMHELAPFAWRSAAFWWQPVEGRHLRLRRPDGGDAVWLKQVFADDAFAEAVNRDYGSRIRRTPQDQLHKQLAQHVSLSPVDLGSHMLLVERQAGGGVIGLACFAEIAALHRRCEFIIGFPATVPAGVLGEVSVLLARFIFGQAGFHRVTASVYADNPMHGAVGRMMGKAGFVQEGVLRQHVRLGRGPHARFGDVHLWGGLAEDVISSPTLRRYARRLDHAASASG